MKSHAANFEESLLFSMRHLGDEVEEIDRWNCCGVTLSLAQDNAMRQLAPIRNLIRVKEADSTRVMTACAMCYNTLKRANDLVRADPALRQRMNTFMYDEKVSYEGDVDVIHVLEALRQKEGFETIRAKVAKPLKGLRVASYYGCLLVRPRSVAFDNVENPVLLDELATALGATAVDFSHKTECCGSYQTVNKPEITADRAFEILTAAHDEGAEIIAVSCPLVRLQPRSPPEVGPRPASRFPGASGGLFFSAHGHRLRRRRVGAEVGASPHFAASAFGRQGIALRDGDVFWQAEGSSRTRHRQQELVQGVRLLRHRIARPTC